MWTSFLLGTLWKSSLFTIGEYSHFRSFRRKSTSHQDSSIEDMFVMRLPNLSSILASKLTPEDLSNFFIDVVKNVVTYTEKKK
jgi:hypothetical protein